VGENHGYEGEERRHNRVCLSDDDLSQIINEAADAAAKRAVAEATEKLKAMSIISAKETLAEQDRQRFQAVGAAVIGKLHWAVGVIVLYIAYVVYNNWPGVKGH